MADANTELKQLAIRVANAIQGRQLAAKKELQEIEAKAFEIKAMLESGNFARERSCNFVPSVSGEYQCPVCWVEREQKSNLRSVSNPDSQDDNFTCPECGIDFAFTP
ncbi:MAG: hypothetical protein Q8R67_00785 [Rhodoferax sp.]|nr:hypothetical protein [Rhodoferax sp.]MDP3650191.1 hypothetical protein [Rhodoferax sp.]